MKGIVFNEFSEMVESTFGEDILDDIIDACDLPSGGAYTSVGTYDHNELINLVIKLSELTDQPVDGLIKAFGNHMATVFSSKYSQFFEECNSTLDFLRKIDSHIHVEVRKLYKDTELPRFSFDDSNSESFILHYKSTRGFADLAHGLIEGCSKHYKESFKIDREDLSKGNNTDVIFTLTKH